MKRFVKQIRDFKQRKTSLRHKWTRSFIIILLFPIIVNYGFYLYFMNNIKEELDAKNFSYYESVVREMDLRIQKYKKISADLGVNALIRQVSNFQDSAAFSDEVNTELKDTLYRYYIDLYSSYRVFLYFDESNIVLSMNELDTSETYFKNNLDNNGINIAEWKRWLSESGNETLAFQGPPNIKGVRPRYIAIRYTIFENRNVNPTNMVIILDEASIFQNIRDFLKDDSVYIDILNETNELIASNVNASMNRDKVFTQLKGKQGTFEITEQNERYNVCHILSDVNAWQYIFYVSKNIYYNKVRILNLIFWSSILLILIAGLVLIREIVGKQYAPVAKILQKMPRKDVEGNEYLEIENMILSSIKIKRESASIAERQEKHHIDHLIYLALNGQMNLPEIEEEVAHKLPIKFETGYNAVAIFSLKPYKELFCKENISDFERYEILVDILENIGQEILSNCRINSYFLEINGNLVCLTNYAKEEYLETLLDALSEILRNVEKHFSVRLVACAGCGYSESDIKESYREALYCLDYISYDYIGNVIFYKDVEKEAENFRAYTIEEENALNTYIRAGEEKNACTLLEQYLRRKNPQKESYSSQYKYYVNEILGSLQRNFQQYIEENSAAVNNIHLLLMVGPVESEQVLQNLQALICSICDKVRMELLSLDSGSSSDIVGKITTYINQNYTDPDLSVEQIATYCDMSVSYISRVFRRETQSSLLNYINRTRIEAAKVLLRDSKLRNEDVAAKVGFLNVNTFIRLFKKYENVTPGIYKKSL